MRLNFVNFKGKKMEMWQDMPPPGGYKPIHFHRVPPTEMFKSGKMVFLAYIAITGVGLCVYGLTARKVRNEKIEMRSARNVIYPILVAERDREYLKQLNRNRDEEMELMKNVAGWEVGTWYGESVYQTLPPDTLVDPIFKEYYAQAPYSALAQRAYLKLRT